MVRDVTSVKEFTDFAYVWNYQGFWLLLKNNGWSSKTENKVSSRFTSAMWITVCSHIFNGDQVKIAVNSHISTVQTLCKTTTRQQFSHASFTTIYIWAGWYVLLNKNMIYL